MNQHTITQSCNDCGATRSGLRNDCRSGSSRRFFRVQGKDLLLLQHTLPAPLSRKPGKLSQQNPRLLNRSASLDSRSTAPPVRNTPARCIRRSFAMVRAVARSAAWRSSRSPSRSRRKRIRNSIDMTRRFWVAVVLTIPVFALGMSDLIPGQPLQRLIPMSTLAWVQLVLATPVVLWAGWPFFVRAWQSIVNRSLNMFTLIGLGVAVGYVFSVIAVSLPGIFPASFRDHHGNVPVYFEAAAVITTLVLLGQVLELRARSQTGKAIKALLGLAPKTARRISRRWTRGRRSVGPCACRRSSARASGREEYRSMVWCLKVRVLSTSR